MIRLAVWLLVALGVGLAWAQAPAEPGLTVPMPSGGGLIPVGDLTLPGALVVVAWMLRGVRPRLVIEHAGEVVVRREPPEPVTGSRRRE